MFGRLKGFPSSRKSLSENKGFHAAQASQGVIPRRGSCRARKIRCRRAAGERAEKCPFGVIASAHPIFSLERMTMLRAPAGQPRAVLCHAGRCHFHRLGQKAHEAPRSKAFRWPARPSLFVADFAPFCRSGARRYPHMQSDSHGTRAGLGSQRAPLGQHLSSPGSRICTFAHAQAPDPPLPGFTASIPSGGTSSSRSAPFQGSGSCRFARSLMTRPHGDSAQRSLERPF